METVDARGRSCPEPVILTKQALSRCGAPIRVLVDHRAAVDNITRFVTNQGMQIQVTEQNGEFTLQIEQGSAK